MSEANKDLVRRYLHDVWSRGDIDGSAAYLTSGYRRHMGANAEPLDPAGQRQRLKAFRLAFPDSRVEIEDMIAEGDKVAFRFTLRGTHQGRFQDIEPTGVKVAAFGLDMVRIEDGLLAEHWGGADLHSIRRQLLAG